MSPIELDNNRKSIIVNGQDEGHSLTNFSNRILQKRLSSQGSMTYIEDMPQTHNMSPNEASRVPFNVEGINTLLNVNHLTPTKLIEQQVKVRSAIQNMIENTLNTE